MTRLHRCCLAALLMATAHGLLGQTATDDSADIDLLINARMQLRDSDVNEAERLTRDFLQKHPASSQAHYLLGFVLFKQAQAKASPDSTPEIARSSLAEYSAGAKYGKPSSLDLKIIGLDYVLMGDLPDADKWLTQSLSWNNHDAEAWYDLGRLKESEKNFTGAARAFEQSVKLDPLNTRAEQARERAVEEQAQNGRGKVSPAQ